MHVVAVSLFESVSMILCADRDREWRFLDWQKDGRRFMGVRPHRLDWARTFMSVEEATTHFRQRYGARILRNRRARPLPSRRVRAAA
jgi:hypothetical protein